MFQSDNGRGYVDDNFKKYCTDNRIKMKKIILGASQQNGIAEIMSRALNAHAMSMRLNVTQRCSGLRLSAMQLM